MPRLPLRTVLQRSGLSMPTLEYHKRLTLSSSLPGCPGRLPPTQVWPAGALVQGLPREALACLSRPRQGHEPAVLWTAWLPGACMSPTSLPVLLLAGRQTAAEDGWQAVMVVWVCSGGHVVLAIPKRCAARCKTCFPLFPQSRISSSHVKVMALQL